MEEKSVITLEGLNELQLPPPSYSITAVAVSGSKKSKYIVKWALEKNVPEEEVYFKLLHVRPVVSRIPTPMGNYIPISQVRDDVAAAFKKDVELQVTEKLLPFKKMCDRRKVQVEIVQIESDDVVTAVAGVIHKEKITKLVIGASSRSFFSRARTLSSKISELCPAFCTVYVISKGKLSSLRPSDSETKGIVKDDVSGTICFTDNSSSHSSSSQIESDQCSIGSSSLFHSSPLPVQRFHALSSINQTLLHKKAPSSRTTHNKNISLDVIDEKNDSIIHPNSDASSFRSSVADDLSWAKVSTSDVATDNQAKMTFELEKLRIELRHMQGMYAMAQGEVIDSSRKINELEKRHLDEELKFMQISFKEEEAEKSARWEKERFEAAKREAESAKENAEREALEREEAENKASREAKEKENLENALMGNFNKYRKFTWEEILSATSSFSKDLKIGTGAYGSVYKGIFHHMTAAVKILHGKGASGTKQFQQELEILSQIHHPHLLNLLGACPDHSCLVYELMSNGNLHDKLINKNDSNPLSYFDRFRIAFEVASALAFLHNAKPKSIIHRDIKPANILLDRNNTSKIGDTGLSTMVLDKESSKDTDLVGTLCYIDPEYQRTGKFSPKSDVYALGMVILQLITGKLAMGLAHKVEVAMENGQLMDVVDVAAGDWPVEETRDLALLALKCTELRGKDRPDLRDEILPVLENLKDVAGKSRDLALIVAKASPPSHFMCPISKEIMTDPCVAADGYTYDRGAIVSWMEEKHLSPVTNLPLQHKLLIPNYTLLSVIMEWNSGKQI